MRISLMAILALFTVSYGAAAEQTVKHYELNIGRQPLDTALKDLATQTGLQVARFSDAVKADTMVGPLSGNYSADEALKSLLAPSGLVYRPLNDRAYIVVTPQELSVTSNARDPLSSATGAFRLAQTETASGAEPQDARLDEVVITGAKRKFAPTDSSAATKIPMEVIDTPQSMTVLSGELLSITGAGNIEAAAALAPSVVARDTDLPIFVDLSVRGFHQNDLNGLKVNGMAIANSGGALDPALFDRVEIVRGPASIIYGQSDYGATINVQLKAPSAKSGFSGELGSSVDGSTRAVADVTGPLGDASGLRGRLITVYDDSRTSQSLAFARSVTVAPSLSWDITPDLTADLSWLHSNGEYRKGTGFGLTTSYTLPAVSQEAFLDSQGDRFRSSNDLGIAKLTYRFGDHWTLIAAAAMSHTNGSWRQSVSTGLVPASGIVPLTSAMLNSATDDSSGEITLSKDFQAFGRTNTVMLDGSVRTNAVDTFICFDPAPLGLNNVFNPNPWSFGTPCATLPDDLSHAQYPQVPLAQHAVEKDDGAGGLVLLHPMERLSIMAGARWNQYDKTNVSYWNRSISMQIPADYKNHKATYRVGLVYEVAQNVNVYVSNSTGLIFGVGETKTGTPLTPESGQQWEIGAKAALLDKKLTLATAAYKIDRKNVAMHDPSTPLTSPYQIGIDGETHKGFEIEAIGEPIPGWNIITSYSYLNVDITAAPLARMVGQQRDNSPHNMFKLYSTYQILNGPFKGVSFGGGLFRTSEREIDNVGTFQLPAYTRLDLRLGCDRWEHVSLSLNAINVTDAKIYTSTGGTAFGYIDFQGRRTVLGQISFKY